MKIEVIKADYLNKQHEEEIIVLLNGYASDPMGGGQPLSETVKETLVKTLSELKYAFSVIAYVDGKPAGLANCFDSFSTFSCKPIVNIHDFVVFKMFRGNGISQVLLDKIEEIGIDKGCCKITMEVLSNNEVAKSAYRKFGFTGYELDPKAGVAQFWQKQLIKK